MMVERKAGWLGLLMVVLKAVKMEPQMVEKTAEMMVAKRVVMKVV